MWRLLYLCFIALTFAEHRKCGLSHEMEAQAHSNTQENAYHGRYLSYSRGTTLAPIRFHFHYELSDNMTPAQEDELKNFLIPTMTKYFSETIKVYPLLRNLVFGSSSTYCYDFLIPSDHKTQGVSADILVYLTAYNAQESVIAWATSCYSEPAPTYNVLAGRVNINMYHFGDDEPLDSKLATLYHEVFHLLGFSNYQFRYFHKPNNVPYATDEVTETITIRGKQATILKLPTVVELARKAFGCDNLRGVEVEDQGGSGTKGSHWDKLIMFNDFMTPDSGVEDYLFSDITFAVLHDSGWYTIDFTKTDQIIWGKGLGCGFFENRCIVNNAPSSSLFCSVKSQKGCTYSRIDKGYCNLATYSSSFPAAYAHFTTTTLGGTDTNMDYCPRFDNYSNGNCRGNGYSTTTISATRGEQVCANCRCFDTTLVASGYTPSTTIAQACYKVRCDRENARYYITVGSTEKECIQDSTLSFTGYSGSLVCPAYNEACMEVPCMAFCLHRGKCVNSICECNDGFGGDYCQIVCDSTCKNCSGTGSNQCIACRTGEILAGDKSCQCPEGYARNASTGVCETSCIGLCLGCVEGYPSLCTSCGANASLSNTSNNNGVVSGSCTCNTGFLQSDRNCIKECNELCSSCVGTTGCAECKENASLSGDRWSCSCSLGYKLEAGACVRACDGLCLTCSNSNTSSCLTCMNNASLPVGSLSGSCSCDTGFEFLNEACIASCNDLCANCNSSAGCTQCKPNAQVSSSNPSSCICKSGYQMMTNSCVAICTGLCRTCDVSNGAICLSCADNAILPTGASSGICSCKPGYVNIDNVCTISCNNLCQSCSSTGCSECKPNSRLIAGNPSECECMPGFSNDNGRCVAVCVGLCASCSENSGTTCITCKNNATLNNGTCSCNTGFIFESGTNICKAQCNSLCVICDSSRGCISCTANSLVNSSINPSVCNCVSGFTLQNNICQASCNISCNTCSPSDGNLCLSCKTNARIEPVGASSGVCVCESGYILNTITGECESWRCPNECSKCTRGLHNCNVCVEGNYYWPDVTGCYSICPSKYLISDNNCVAVSETVFEYYFNSYGIEFESKGFKLTGYNVKPGWSRGLYFSHAYASISGNLVLSPSHYISMWLRLDSTTSTRTILSKYGDKIYYKLTLNSLNQLSLIINKESFNDSFSNTPSTIDIGSLSSGIWHNIAIVFNFRKPDTIITFYNKSNILTTITLPTAFFKDYLASSSGYITLGAHYTGGVYTEMFSGFIAAFKVANTANYNPSSYGNECVMSGFCLVNCSLTQYFDAGCKGCNAACMNGCIRGTDCRLNEDPLCASFENYKGCSECMMLAGMKNGKCECVENAGFRSSSSTCTCNIGYKETNGRCLTCLNYYKASEVSANFSSDYLKIIVNFSRAARSTADNKCSTLINEESVSKLGTNPICSWNIPRTVLTITLGQSATITTEPLFLKEFSILAAGNDCSFLSETLSPTVQALYPAPNPTISLTGPSSLSLFCKSDITYTISNITGGMSRPLIYTWTFTEFITSELDSYLKTKNTSYTTIPYSYFKEGTYTIVATATNFLGKSGYTTRTLEVRSDKRYPVVIDVGSEVAMKASEKRSFVASLSSLCGSSSSYKISWSFLASTETNFRFNEVLRASNLEHILLVNENELSAGFRYTFRATVEDSEGNTGFADLVINAVFDDLVVMLDKVDGQVSASSELNISAAKSYDPNNSDAKLEFRWSCVSGNSNCLASNGSNLIRSETGPELKIPSSKLAPGSSYTFTVTVSVPDGRSASKSVKLTIIEAPSCSISIRNLKPKYNPQVDFVFPMTVKCPTGTSYAFTQTSGTSVPIIGSKLVAALFIPANTMIQGENLSFEFAAVYEGMTIGSSTISWLVNRGPSSGSFSITPSTGVHLKTVFTLSALNFQDADGQDMPLKYTFFIQTSTGYTVNLSPSNNSNTIKLMLSTTTSRVGVKACDNLGTCRTLPSTVRVSRSRMLQTDSLLSMYLDYTRDPEMIPVYTILFTQEVLDSDTYTTIKNTFINYMIDKQDYTTETRKTGYAGYIGLLKQDSWVTAKDAIEMIQYIRDSVKYAEDEVSNQEMNELMDQLLPIASRFGEEIMVLNEIALIIEDMLSLSRQEMTPISLEEYGETQSKYYYGRVKGSELSNYAQTVGNVKVMFGEDGIDSDKVVDLSIVVYNDDSKYGPIVQIGMRDSGSVEDANFEVNTAREKIKKLNSDKTVRVKMMKDVVTGVELDKEVVCVMIQEGMTEFEGNCRYYNDGRVIMLESNELGLYRLINEESEVIDPAATDEDDSNLVEEEEECEINLAPAILLIIIVGAFNISLTIILTLSRKSSNEILPILTENRTIFTKSENLNISQSKEIQESTENQLDSSSQRIDTEMQVLPNAPLTSPSASFSPPPFTPSQISSQPKPFCNLFCENHLITKITRSSTQRARVYYLITLLAICLFEFAILGAIYHGFEEPEQGSEMYSGKEIAKEYSGIDFLYCLLCGAIAVPCSVGLQYCVIIEKKCGFVAGMVCAIGFIVGSLGGIIYMIVMYCHKYAGLWTMGTLLVLVMEFALFQNFIAFGAAFASKIRNKVRK